MFMGLKGLPKKGVPAMCDYSLQNVRSRPARVGDKLTTRDFGTCTRGFAAAEDVGVAVCVLPGTELAFSNAVTLTDSFHPWVEGEETRLRDSNFSTRQQE